VAYIAWKDAYTAWKETTIALNAQKRASTKNVISYEIKISIGDPEDTHIDGIEDDAKVSDVETVVHGIKEIDEDNLEVLPEKVTP
jgi:hypothetical protein